MHTLFKEKTGFSEENIVVDRDDYILGSKFTTC